MDIVVRLHQAAMRQYGNDPAGLIDTLYTVVRRYSEQHGLKVTRWDRCITLEYSDGMCVDITPVIEDERIGMPHGATHARVPDRDLRLFEPTNPKGLAGLFDEAARVRAVFTLTEALKCDSAETRADLQPLPNATDVQSRLLSRFVQMLKLHRNVAFGGADTIDFSPPSVFVTSLAATAYATRAPIPHDSPLDLALDIVDTMPMFFQRQPLPGGREFWLLANLTAPGDNLASGMNTQARQEAYVEWHHRLKLDLQRMLDCIEHRHGLDRILDVVERAFGQRAVQAIRELEAPKPLPQSERRVVVVGTGVAGTALSLPARGHRFYGD